MRKIKLLHYLTLIVSLIITMYAQAAQSSEPLKPFKAYYKSKIRLGWFSIGVKATRELSQQADGNWLLDFTAEASVAKVKESSLMRFNNGQYQPLSYRYRATGLVDEPDQTLNFKASNRRVEDLENNKTFNVWNNKIQDNISYMMQASLDLMANKTELVYPVFERRKIKDFKFKILAKENLKTDFGVLKTIKIEQVIENKNKHIYAWLASDYQYVLARLQEVDKGKTRYNIELTDLKMPAN